MITIKIDRNEEKQRIDRFLKKISQQGSQYLHIQNTQEKIHKGKRKKDQGRLFPGIR